MLHLSVYTGMIQYKTCTARGINSFVRLLLLPVTLYCMMFHCHATVIRINNLKI